MTNPRRINQQAYAKINLALSVGPPEPATPTHSPHAGMHPIASWMHAIDLCDDVIIETIDGDTSTHQINWADNAPRSSTIDWAIQTDLAVKAHRLLEKQAGRTLAVNMAIHKRIPVGAGLGGGSSDAAAAFIAINRLFDLGYSHAELATMSATLGSDIAFFIDTTPARAAIVSGFGDQIERINPCQSGLVLLLPPFGCATGPVYSAYDTLGPQQLRQGQVQTMARAGSITSSELFNDLATPAKHVQPTLAKLHHAATQAIDEPVHITGSGSTMFVVTDSPQNVARCIQNAVAKVVCIVTRLVG